MKRSSGLTNETLADRKHKVPVQCHHTQTSWRTPQLYAPRKRFFSCISPNCMNLEAKLKEAKALVQLADYEPDPITQEMMYLDSILSFVFSGHLMENNGTRKRAVIKIYNDTIDLIKVIWCKIYNYRADCNHEELDEIFKIADHPERDNRLLVLWMKCIGFLRLKLFKLLITKNRRIFTNLQQHFQKNVSVNQDSQSPSSARSVGSCSFGYRSRNITPKRAVSSSSAATGMIGIPVVVYNALQLQHTLFCHSELSHEMWQYADLLIMRGKHTQFFVEMDRYCGPLTLHSTGHDLASYARIAISRMRCEFRIKNYLP